VKRIRNAKEFDFIVRSGEGYTVEFKENVNSDLAKEMVAFANASGGRIFIGANSQKMTTREITEFIQAEGRVRFDETLRDDVDINKVFDPKLLNRYLQLSQITKTLDDYSILENLGVLSFKNKKPVLNNAGLLFFSNTVSPHLFFATITCALYKGNQKVTVLDRKDFSADIISNIEDTMIFLKKHLNLRYEIKTLQRKEILEIPEVALREAIINAACHRDYYEKGANIMVEIFDDRVQITNPGGLPKGLPKEKFGTLSVSRNPIISSLFHRANYIERMGTGIYRIKEALKEAGNPVPEFDCDQFFTLIFKREMVETTVETMGNRREEVRKKYGRSTEEIRKKYGVIAEKIILKIKDNPNIKIKEIAVLLSVSQSAVEKNISKLKKDGLLQHIGSTKGGYWEVVEDEK